MQDNWRLYYSEYQESSDSHYSETAPANSATSIDITSTFTYAGVPVEPQEWSSAVASTIGNNNDGSLTAVLCVAENVGYATHQATPNRTPPMLLTSFDHSTDAHSRPWRSAVAAVTADAYAPQTAWNERSAALTQLNRSQVPSGLTFLDSRRDHCHAVGAPALPTTFLRDTDYSRYPTPGLSYLSVLPEVSASPTIPARIAGLGNVSPYMVDPVLGQTPSPSNRRRCHRRPRARVEHVICGQCRKLMRRQSLRRHIREVHDHIKRPHPKPSFATGP